MMLEKSEGMEISMEYEITVKDIDDVMVVSERFTGDYKDNIKYAMKLSKKYWKDKQGPIFSLYYDKEYQKVNDTECCIPVKAKYNKECKVIPGVRAVCTKHIGRYETIGNAYMAILQFLRQNGLEMDVPTRLVFEKYPRNPVKVKDDDYVTEVIIPIKEE